MKKIFFANHAQFEGRYTNLGDWAIFEQMVDCLSKEIAEKKIEVLVPSAEPEYTNSHYEVKAFKRGGLIGIINTMKAIVASDIVVIGGGEIVQDRSSIVYIPYQLIRPLIAKIFGKKLFAYAIGVGEKDEISFLGKLQARFVLNMFDIITVRDEKSYTVLKEYLKVKKPRIFLTADPALNLRAKSRGNIKKTPFFVVSVRSVYHRNHNILPFSIRKKLGLVPKKYYKEIDCFKDDVAYVIDSIIKKYGCNVRFLNTYIGKQMSASDDKFTMDIINRLSVDSKDKAEVININNTPSENKSELANAQFILTVPLHPLILGASENVPVLSLAYASKNICFMKQIKQDNYIYTVEKMGEKVPVSKILSDVDYLMENREYYVRELEKEVDSLKKIEQQNAKLLLDLIKDV